jgi:outer membrane immunogenic protein
MKRLPTAIAATALIATPAFAADMAFKAPAPVPPPSFSWTGCYIGGHGGYGWGRNSNQFNSVLDNGHQDSEGVAVGEFADYSPHLKGWLGGVQYGCNTQTGNLVFGIENEWFWTGMKGSVTRPDDEAGHFTQLDIKNRVDTTLAARFGYAVDRNLFYGKVGVGWGRFDYNMTHDDFTTPESMGTRTDKEWEAGLMLGAGWEYAFYDNWSFKVEYDHIWFQTQDVIYPQVGNGSPPITTFHATNSKDIVKVGLNYRFGSVLGLLGLH